MNLVFISQQNMTNKTTVSHSWQKVLTGYISWEPLYNLPLPLNKSLNPYHSTGGSGPCLYTAQTYKSKIQKYLIQHVSRNINNII